MSSFCCLQLFVKHLVLKCVRTYPVFCFDHLLVGLCNESNSYFISYLCAEPVVRN